MTNFHWIFYKCTLEILDIYGRKVITLLDNEMLVEGKQSRAFNISRLASGTYTYRLISNGTNAKGLIIKQ